MTAPVFERLHKVLSAVRAAEEARLAALLARIAACRDEARRLRAEAVAVPAQGAAAAAPQSDAAVLVALERWRAHLTREARAAEARAEALGREAEPLRESLANALAREQAAADLAEQARAQVRREALRRVEAAAVAAPRSQLL